MPVKKAKSGMQWKVVSNIHISALERTLEEWTGRGWTVFAILGPAGYLNVVLHRMLVL